MFLYFNSSQWLNIYLFLFQVSPFVGKFPVLSALLLSFGNTALNKDLSSSEPGSSFTWLLW